MFLFDLKVIDENLSMKYTGADINIILKNLKSLVLKKKDFIIRLPLIPGVTDTKENIKDILSVLKKHGINYAEALPYNPPKTYHEALVTLKLIHFFARLTDITHITFGRFDQYMYPFYKHDIENGMTKDEILELTEEFFISINFDSDLYFGVQKGDNGQSMVLGGLDIDGNDTYNELSEICVKASLELSLIDPKINLRVSKKTPDELYRFGTLLTKQELGFPQYCNDDVVIPGLINLGYAPEDAYNYAVAALVKLFVELGGHQLQLNSINRETLIDAQNHPEDHKNLIVRVWGWSGYFNELDKKFQDHIISRTEFQI